MLPCVCVIIKLHIKPRNTKTSECVCVVIPFILDVRVVVDVAAGVAQEEGLT